MMNQSSLKQVLVETVEGPHGRCEVYEIQESLSSIIYEVRFNNEALRFDSIGEAYIEAGIRAGKPV